MRKRLLRVVVAAGCLLCGFATCQAAVVSFGSGANQFNMEFVTIGNPGNAPEYSYGRVDYEYSMGKFEVSRDMVMKFNASQSLQITLYDMTTYGGNGLNKPSVGLTWNEAARFVNWLNTSTGGYAAYRFKTSGVNDNISVWSAAETDDYDPLNPYRSKRATYVLPSYNEWHKAAFYDPRSSTYHDYPNGRNSPPVHVASGTEDNTAVFAFNRPNPADVTQAGGLSPYGIMGLGGNAYEWTETSDNFRNAAGASKRWFRGGDSSSQSGALKRKGSLWHQGTRAPSQGDNIIIGFRVASLSSSGSGGTGGEVPEPTSMAIFGLGALGIAYRTRRRM